MRLRRYYLWMASAPSPVPVDLHGLFDVPGNKRVQVGLAEQDPASDVDDGNLPARHQALHGAAR